MLYSMLLVCFTSSAFASAHKKAGLRKDTTHHTLQLDGHSSNVLKENMYGLTQELTPTRFDSNNVWLPWTSQHVLNKVEVSFPQDAYAFGGALEVVTESAVSTIKGYTVTLPQQGGSNPALKIRIEFATNIKQNSHVVIRFGGITFREVFNQKPVQVVQFPADEGGSTRV